MHNTALLASVMAGVVGLGGLMGFVKAGSKISLIAGGSVAAGYGYVAYAINNENGSVQQNSNIAIGLSVLLAIGMGMRYRKVVTKEGKPGTLPLAVALLGVAAAAGFALLK